MSSMTFSTKRLTLKPPDKGSFPLDHEGICKELMLHYMDCLRVNKKENSKCREEIKNYLDCRMNNDLMAKEPWSKLGFSEYDDVNLKKKEN